MLATANQDAFNPPHGAHRAASLYAMKRLRLDRARADLEDGGLPVERIALASGFGDPERMRRAFLRVYGRPPQDFRRKALSSARPAMAGSA